MGGGPWNNTRGPSLCLQAKVVVGGGPWTNTRGPSLCLQVEVVDVSWRALFSRSQHIRCCIAEVQLEGLIATISILEIRYGVRVQKNVADKNGNGLCQVCQVCQVQWVGQQVLQAVRWFLFRSTAG